MSCSSSPVLGSVRPCRRAVRRETNRVERRSHGKGKRRKKKRRKKEKRRKETENKRKEKEKKG